MGINKNIIKNREKIMEIMTGLNEKLTSAFIRVARQENIGIFDSDLVNIGLSDVPIYISKTGNNIKIFDSGEIVFTIEMKKFSYADIEGMNKKSDYGFLRGLYHSIAISFTDGRYIVFYYQENIGGIS